MDTLPVHPTLTDLSKVFSDAGFHLYLVGGAVRDAFLGKDATDWDVATEATPQEVMKIFRHVIPTGIAHGTVTIPYRGHHIECTTFRTEEGYADGRHPDSIAYAGAIEDDLSRRDFTMNAIAVSLPDGKVVDPFFGRKAIHDRVIVTVGKPELRFAEDGLRPLRAVRFSAQLNFSIDSETLRAIPGALPVTAKVAHERIRDELVKLLESTRPSVGLRFMESSGLLNLIMPELSRCRGVDQKGRHAYDVLDHLYASCDYAPRENIPVRIAALFHDVGKPLVRICDDDGSYTFYNHEEESARIAERIMTRLRFPLKTAKTVTHLIRQHMFHYETSWTDAAVRRFIVRVGEESLNDIFDLRMADASGIIGKTLYPPELYELRERIDAVIAQAHAFGLKDLAVNGSDLSNNGIPKGPLIGIILAELLDAVLEDPTLNTKSKLLDISAAIYANRVHSDQ